MTAFEQAFDALRGLIRDAQGIYPCVNVGALPPGDSMATALSTGSETGTDLALHGDLDLDFVLNARHRSQRAVLGALTDVHYRLSRRKDLPGGEGWQILSIATSAYPSYLEHDGGQYLYGSALRVLLYLA